MSSKTIKWVPVLIAVFLVSILFLIIIIVFPGKTNIENQNNSSSIKIVQRTAPPGLITPNKEKAGEAVSFVSRNRVNDYISYYDSDGNFKVCFYDGREIFKVYEYIQDGSASVNYLNAGSE